MKLLYNLSRANDSSYSFHTTTWEVTVDGKLFEFVDGWYYATLHILDRKSDEEESATHIRE